MSAPFSDPARPPGRPSAATVFNTLLPVISAALTVGLIVSLVIIGNFTPGGASTAAPVAAGMDHSAAAPAAGKKVTVEIEEGDMYIKPASIEVPAGADVTVHVANKGAQQHTLALQGADTPLIDPGASATMHWGVLSQSTQAWCIVAGHKDAGMLLNVNVAGSAATPAPAATAAAAHGAAIDPNAKPAADWTPRDPTLPPADGNPVHNATFRVTEQTMDVAPGVAQVRWTFTAQFAGTFTYHCGADPMIYHMGNGMFGAVVIDPPNLDKVDQELVLVQSELYLGANGQPGDLKKMLAGTDDAVVFNGYYNQYAFAPIKVKPGARIRVWLDNAGPNEDMAFHTVGTIFDTVWKEGHYELTPNNPDHGGSQTLDLQPTQGGFVEFTLPDAGTYPFISHKMMNMSRGALGLFQVG